MTARWIAEAKARGLAGVRRGQRRVLWAPPTVYWGNLLYLWQHAHIVGNPEVEVVRVHDHSLHWLEAFPRLAELSVRASDVRFRDQRINESDFSFFGSDFTADDLASFVGERLLPSGHLAAVDADELVVNVRRGDYYSDPRFRPHYGFDQIPYLRAAAAASIEAEGAPAAILVVSDDLDWCREHLAWLQDLAPVRFGAGARTPLRDFCEVATRRRLIITNSSFSYWAAYVSNVLFGDNHASVHVPRMHRWDMFEGDAWQLDPRWRAWDVAKEPAT